MKTIHKITTILTICICSYLISSCQKDIIEPGFDRVLSGTVIDQSGNIVPGTITKNDLSVYLLGEGETQPTVLRVNGEGEYQNTKLYHQVYKVWIDGPVFYNNPSDTIILDLANNKNHEQDWVVTPHLSLSTPEVVSTPASSSVDISYAIVGNQGKTASRREIYVSTNPYPTTSTGSGLGYHTIKKALETDSGEIKITGLESGTKYYVRVAGSPDGSRWNYSKQIEFTTP